MQVTLVNALDLQRQALETCSLELFEQEVMERIGPFWKPFMNRFPGGNPTLSPAMNAAQMMGYYSPLDDCQEGIKAITAFEQANTWQACATAAQRALDALSPETHGLKLGPIHFTFILGNLKTLKLEYGAYTGAQGMGSALVMGWPNEIGTPRLPVASAHEINHLVRFAFEPFMPNLTLGKYLVAEGLAESFALEIVGDKSLIGPYSSALSQSQLEAVKPKFSAALYEADFNVARAYIFGDWAAEQFHYPKKGIPDYAGYTVGFELVQTYLRRSGKTATEATYIPWEEIVNESGYFEEA
ncbi:MAG: hypothetical protein KC422_09855 [Trueperaceae bacterium]|nr:hypothetical protein [Trueperaceae bacterium]